MPPVSACVGISLGHCEMRVCAFRDRPEIVASETGGRCTPATLALTASGEWLVGDAAVAQAPKNRDGTIEVMRLFEMNGLETTVVDGEDAVVLRGTPVSTEDAWRKLFGHLRGLVDAFLDDDEPVAAVVAVPLEVVTPRATTILKAAARASRFEIVQFVRDAEAVAVAHDVDASCLVAVVDLGGSRSECSVLESRAGVLARVATESDRGASGRALTACLERFCTAHLMRQNLHVQGDRAVAKLRDACARAAKMLASTAQQADVEADALVDGVDCRVRVTRPRFDDLCTDVYKRIPHLVDRAFENCRGRTILPLFSGVAARGDARMRRDALTAMARHGTVLPSPSLPCYPDEAPAFGAAKQAALLAFGTRDDDPPATRLPKGPRRILSPRIDALHALEDGDDECAKLPHSAVSLDLALDSDDGVELVPLHAPLPCTLSRTLNIADEHAELRVLLDRTNLLATIDVTSRAGAVVVSASLDRASKLKLALDGHVAVEC